jgi:hypothetical protein
MILANPVYTGRMVWNRQCTDRDLVDPDNTGLGHRDVRRWNAPDQWVISDLTVHPALVSETDFIAIQGLHAEREDAKHTYLLTGLLRCTLCERAFEGHWVRQTPGYRCRHGRSSTTTPDAARPKNTYLPEMRITAKLPLPHHLLTIAGSTEDVAGATASAATTRPPAKTPEEVIDHLREHALVLCYDPRTRALGINGSNETRVTL